MSSMTSESTEAGMRARRVDRALGEGVEAAGEPRRGAGEHEGEQRCARTSMPIASARGAESRAARKV